MKTSFKRVATLAPITITAVASLVVPLWLLGVRPPTLSPGSAHAAPDSTLTVVRAPAPPPARHPAVQHPKASVASARRTAFVAAVHTRPQLRPRRRPPATHVAPVLVRHVVRTPPHTPVVTTVRKPRPSRCA